MKFKLNYKFAVSAAITLAWAVIIFMFSMQNGQESLGLSGKFVGKIFNIIHVSPDRSIGEIIKSCIRKLSNISDYSVPTMLPFGLLGKLVELICHKLNISTNRSMEEIFTICIRKSAHMTEYAILATLILNTLRLGFGRLNKRLFFIAIALASLYAVSDEIHQLFVPERTGKPLDCFIDSTGAVLGALAFYVVMCIAMYFKNKKSQKNSRLNIEGRINHTILL